MEKQDFEKILADTCIQRLQQNPAHSVPALLAQAEWDELRLRIKKNTFGPDDTVMTIFEDIRRAKLRTDLQDRLVIDTKVSRTYKIVVFSMMIVVD